VLASNREAVVFSQRGPIFYGCLKALGVTRLLLDARVSHFVALIAVRLAGRFAALEPEYFDAAQGGWEDATLYDLSSGKATHLAHAAWGSGLDSLVLESSGFAAWRETHGWPGYDGLLELSCPSASLCVAGDEGGIILTSSHPFGGPGAWSSGASVGGPNQSIVGLSCPSVSLCVAAGAVDSVDSTDAIFVSTDPTGGKSAWRKTTLRAKFYLRGVSCPSLTLCVVVGTGTTDGSGARIATSHDPDDASTWSSTRVGSGGEVLEAVSCPSVSLCVATTGTGDVVASTDPTGGARAWKETPIDPGNHLLSAVSCPSVSMCVAGDDDGNILTSTNPTGGKRAWRRARLEPGRSFNAISCPSISLCVVGDDNGNILTSTHPPGGERAWRKAPAHQEGPPPPHSLYAVSCPSVSLCIASDINGYILTSTDPTGGTNAWSFTAVDLPGCPQPSAPCTSERLMVRDDHGTEVVDTAPRGHGNSIGNVALNGDSLALSWTHASSRRQLQLR
jgi:hypothetical protein